MPGRGGIPVGAAEGAGRSAGGLAGGQGPAAEVSGGKSGSCFADNRIAPIGDDRR